MAQQVQNGVQRYAELTQELLGLRERTDEVLGEMRDLGSQLGLFDDPNQGDNRKRTETTANKRTGNNTSTSSNNSSNSSGEGKRGRGRPKGSGKKKTEGGDEQGGSTDLPSLLAQIASEENGLKLADFVTKARERGYKSKAGDFSNMVYQALMKMVHRGELVRDEDRNYRSAA